MSCSECPHDMYVEITEDDGFCLNLQRQVDASSDCEREGAE